ncbi:hypothetical protein HETIRDRAFT_377052 [Heterobasidion irregulare TC 32-1]|uniref:Uncharacterized protein n=1 Tax=Heterobasidion irregulare (strain TC 32-1) TaxID=747525 RepID=W4KKT8_HETIT|nr:uncharacterized protein HETIRDRAFT_377052 [Heterobasidion irregulare TC 32-1]ETW86437.1 hypothetical protein HETIRDRAFT_377052 [Heterobasidion irregulare TC 32-1]
MKVVCIGAGFSGITAGIRFSQRVPNIDLKIYDKAAGVGGTWYANKYPGLACDIPSHCYQLTFEENRQWSSFYAPGPEILAYLQNLVMKYKITRYIHLRHELMSARWDADAGKWHLRIRRHSSLSDGKTEVVPPSPASSSRDSTLVDEEYEDFEDITDVLFLGTGALSRWSWPDIEGLNNFKGRLLHSAQWDVSDGAWEEGVKDWNKKDVGVIGLGSTALQIVPALQPKVNHLVNFVRGKTWIAPSACEDKLVHLLSRPSSGNHTFTEEERRLFEDTEYYKSFRHSLESELNAAYSICLRDSPIHKAVTEIFRKDMVARLAKKPWIADYIVPSFEVGCKRLTPGPGYLEALCEENVHFETTHIKRVTHNGVELIDGRHHKLDVLVCATGFETSYRMPFDVIGREGRDLRVQWEPHASAYLAVAVDGFPNMFMSLGPNSFVNAGSLLGLMERQVDYAVAATLKLQRERLKSMEVKAEAVADYNEYLKDYFPKTVFSGQCRSWYKSKDGSITGLWPGSCLHAICTLSHPRWEDFNYELFDKTRNRFFWLGDGQTHNEKMMTGDRAWYLNDDQVDIPPVPID